MKNVDFRHWALSLSCLLMNDEYTESLWINQVYSSLKKQISRDQVKGIGKYDKKSILYVLLEQYKITKYHTKLLSSDASFPQISL